MVTEPMLGEYLDALRAQVCSHCIERPPGGPPCLPLGKRCGLELHLAKVVEMIHSTDSLYIDPFADRLHEDICACCAYRETDHCPCALAYLLPLVVLAIETVDARHRDSESEKEPPLGRTHPK